MCCDEVPENFFSVGLDFDGEVPLRVTNNTEWLLEIFITRANETEVNILL